MTDELTERNRLRAERARLNLQIAALVAESERVNNSTNVHELHQHFDELARHEREYREFVHALYRFRELYGPLGD